MVDRLADLTGGLPQEQESIDEEIAEAGGKKGKGFEDGSNEEFMKEFFEEVNAIKAGMATIRRNIRAIEESYSASLVAINLEQGNKTSDELEKYIDSTNLAASDVRNKLKDMDEENKKLKKGSAQFRIRTNMHGTLTKKFIDLMSEYQEVQNKYKNKYKERVERQYKIVKPDATQAEIDEALESGNTQVFAAQILDTKHAAAKDALAFIENRHRDIMRLEQSIKELHQLFLDMAILVESQGELIDQIEYNVSQSVAYTKEAAKQLQQAGKYQKKSRKKICCLIIILIIVFILLGGGGAIGGVFGSK